MLLAMGTRCSGFGDRHPEAPAARLPPAPRPSWERGPEHQLMAWPAANV